MNIYKTLLLLGVLIAATSIDSMAEKVPSLVVPRPDGYDYRVPRSEFTKIRLNSQESTYTLESNKAAYKNLMLDAAESPRIYLQDVDEDDMQTSVECVSAEAREIKLSYDSYCQELTVNSEELVFVAVYNVSGAVVLRDSLGAGSLPISVSALPPGIYIAVGYGDNNVRSLRFIKH